MIMSQLCTEACLPIPNGNVEAGLYKVYLCTGVEVGAEKSYWVTGFSPSMVKITEKPSFPSSPNIHQVEGTVHHMAVVGCGVRMETPRNLWNCGANGEPALQPGYPALTPCHSEVPNANFFSQI